MWKTNLALIAVTLAATVAPPTAYADDGTRPCESGRVVVSAGRTESAVTHRAVSLTFSLPAGAAACTLTGYPGVDTGAGGPLLHADRTARGYLGGLPDGVETPPTVTVAPSQPAYAVVEGTAVADDGGPCPTYTELRVTAPDTAETVSVPVSFDTCRLSVHPMGSTTTRESP